MNNEQRKKKRMKNFLTRKYRTPHFFVRKGKLFVVDVVRFPMKMLA